MEFSTEILPVALQQKQSDYHRAILFCNWMAKCKYAFETCQVNPLNTQCPGIKRNNPNRFAFCPFLQGKIAKLSLYARTNPNLSIRAFANRMMIIVRFRALSVKKPYSCLSLFPPKPG